MAPARPFAALLLLLCAAAAFVLAADAAGTADGSEEWGYVQVRPSNYKLSTRFPSTTICYIPLSDAYTTVLCRGAHVLVAVPQPAARGQRQDAMADRALAAGRSGE
jgi:hypothetical protein